MNLGQHGRLGNQLFQYASLKSVALHNGYECKIPNPERMKWHGQECLLNNFSLECDFLTQDDLKSLRHLYTEPNINCYDANILNIPDNTNLWGFFQSTKYFANSAEQIKQEFRLRDEIEKEAKERIAKIKKDNKSEIVSLHIRRGDLTDGTVPKPVNYLGA